MIMLSGVWTYNLWVTRPDLYLLNHTTTSNHLTFSLRKCNSKVTWMGGMSGRQGRFSGLVTDGMSSMGATTGLVGPRWMWALAMLALVGLVGLAALMLCSDATGKGPACPGLECYEGKKGKGVGKWQKFFDTASTFTFFLMWNVLFILVL